VKITAIETMVLRLPFSYEGPPLFFAGKPRNGMEMLLVRVDTDEGITGWGEAFGPGIWAATRATFENLITPLCLGRQPSEIAAIGGDLERKLHQLGRAGSVIYAISGLDIALWDIAGKVAGQPICRMLNPAARTDIPAYASLLRCIEPDLVASVSAQAVGRGYRHVKLHETTVAATRAARNAIGADIKLMLDVNCAWSVEQSLEIAEAVRPLDLLWLEEPIWPPEDYAGLASIRERCGIPLAAGENVGVVTDFAHMTSFRAVDHIQPSVIKVGGITAMLHVCDLAGTRGVKVAPHSPYFGPGLLATMHLCAARPEIGMVERYYCDLDASPLGKAIDPVDGRLTLPKGPGLGVDPDPAVIARCRIA
jgi:L-alanine-DL-glutamate epimerase-like enolase superfamily enzyme